MTPQDGNWDTFPRVCLGFGFVLIWLWVRGLAGIE